MFRHRLLQELGAMAASLNGVDVLAFTGGIGEHDQALRDEIQEAINWWRDVQIDVIPADEEGMIARLYRRQASAEISCDREIRGLMQKPIETEPVNVQGSLQLPGKLTEFLFNVLWDANIKHAHQGFDGEQMGIDVLEIRRGLMDRIQIDVVCEPPTEERTVSLPALPDDGSLTGRRAPCCFCNSSSTRPDRVRNDCRAAQLSSCCCRSVGNSRIRRSCSR